MIRVTRPGEEGYLELFTKRHIDLEEVEELVKEIIYAVKSERDRGLSAVTARIDGVDLQSVGIAITAEEIQNAFDLVSTEFLSALRRAAENIFDFHRRQLRNSWIDTHPDGVNLGQIITPLTRVGIYVPGGKASYPSSVLMNAIPAAVAGVKEIVMVTPPGPGGGVNPHTLVAAAEAGVKEIYRVGGAQAIAALAFGTETIAGVDKIVGPGNIYVTAAKRLVYGTVDIDMLAGPSEVLIVADGTARPEFIAADMLAQAEHDEMASAILVTNNEELARRVASEVQEQLGRLARKAVAEKAIRDRGAAIIADSMEECLEIANTFAPEHLELMIEEPYRWLGSVKNAGAVFMGSYSPEPVGDYFAGPNHVLPTNGTARFFSPLNVDTFMKKISLIDYSKKALLRDGNQIIALATMEGLDAHAAAIRCRLGSDDCGGVKR